jgi:hypothetical protein
MHACKHNNCPDRRSSSQAVVTVTSPIVEAAGLRQQRLGLVNTHSTSLRTVHSRHTEHKGPRSILPVWALVAGYKAVAEDKG